MILGLLLLCASVLALVITLTSALVGGGLALVGRRLERRSAAARARLLFVAALAPATVGAAFAGGTTVDWAVFGHLGHHCIEDNLGAWPSLPMLGLLLLLGVRTLRAVMQMGVGVRRASALRRGLDDASIDRGPLIRTTPLAGAQAFVLGFFRPKVYLSRGLLDAVDAPALEAVLAHELAHVCRRDPLRRVVASLALSLHLPGVAGALSRRLTLAHELAADAAAVSSVGSGSRVAGVLLQLARLRVRPPEPATALLSADLEIRVRDLLRAEARSDRPGAAALVAATGALFALAIVGSAPIHTLFERLLALLRA